jgi:hypothetical protein
MKVSRAAQGALPLLAITTNASTTTTIRTTSSIERKLVIPVDAPLLWAEGALVSAIVAAWNKAKVMPLFIQPLLTPDFYGRH